MSHKTIKNGKDVSILWEGEFTFNQYPAFRKAIDEALEGKPEKVTIDLAQTDYIDSAGLGMFLVAQERSKKENWEFAIANPRERVSQMFQLVKLNTIIDISTTNE